MATGSSINEVIGHDKESGFAEKKQFGFASIADAVSDLKTGRMIVVIDDEDRENEGDLMMAAEISPPSTSSTRAARSNSVLPVARFRLG